MTLDIREISELLPHRYPFLLVDRVLELVPGERCKAVKNVTVNEPFFVGHFPDRPTMPGVLILESMAQTGALILLSLAKEEKQILYLAGAERVRFKKPVLPGDVLVNEVRLLWHRRGFGRIDCKALVDGEVVAEAEMAYSLSARDR
ncbi:MAG: 3-hydroxyacyl-ACP dehydratase FabZ [Armatimonadota bacterium]